MIFSIFLRLYLKQVKVHGVVKNVDFVLAGSVMSSEERSIVAKVHIVMLRQGDIRTDCGKYHFVKGPNKNIMFLFGSNYSKHLGCVWRHIC